MASRRRICISSIEACSLSQLEAETSFRSIFWPQRDLNNVSPLSEEYHPQDVPGILLVEHHRPKMAR